MNNSRKTGITGYYIGQAVTLGLALLALHLPAGAQTPGAIPIAFGQTVRGTLTSTDRLLEDGRPVDTYIFTAALGQRYFIKAASPDIPLIANLFRLIPGGGLIGQQDAFVFRPGQTVGFFGVINLQGRYGIDVSSVDEQQPTGPSGTASYTLSLLDLNLNAPRLATPAAP